ncbi:MAG TPA: T9SS type A sorting domain-containing protein [Adhaeribacter sp.]|nr:T9SS type A sorting domain-containing protein [Adhaeribacter sp.]
MPTVLSSPKPEIAREVISLGQSYPNPATASAIIPYTLPEQYSKASILLREIATGREIRRYELKRGHSSLNVDLSNLSNGLYLYSLVVDEKPVATKKLAVMK